MLRRCYRGDCSGFVVRNFWLMKSITGSRQGASCPAMEIVAASSAASRLFLTAVAAAGSVEFGMLTMRVADVFVFVRNAAQLGEFILYVIAAIVADVIK